MNDNTEIDKECNELSEVLERLIIQVREYKRTRKIDAECFKANVFRFIRKVFNFWL